MSLIEVSNYSSLNLQELKKLFILNSLKPSDNISISPNAADSTLVKYKSQKIVILIDLIPSMYSYHSGLKDIIYNQINPTISTLIKGLYSLSLELEVSVLCTRLSQRPLHAIVQSYLIAHDDDYHDLLHAIKLGLQDLHINMKLSKEESRSIKFNTVLKWSLFTLEMMNKNSIPMIILITNTVDSFIGSAIYDGLVMQYCANEVAFNVISLCSTDKLRLGLVSDHLSLKDAAKATGGQFINPGELSTSLESMFFRKVFKAKQHTHKHLILEYNTELELENIINCRLKEGFNLWQPTDPLIFGLICGNNTKIEYTIQRYNTLYGIQIFLISSTNLYLKVKDKLKATVISTKDSEPAFHERISWIIENILETERISLEFSKVVNGSKKLEHLSTLNVNIWHRWMDVERFDIVTSKFNSEFHLMQGRKRVFEGLKSFCSEFESDVFVEVALQRNLMIGRLVWEGVNKAALFVGFFGGRNLEQYLRLNEALQACTGIEIYNKALGRMLVENISTTKNSMISPIQSAQTYKPHIEALKAYILRRHMKYKMICTNWCQVLMDIIYESKLKKGYFFLGNCANNKALLYKPQKIQQGSETKILFFQFLIYIVNNEVNVEFYIDPECINNEETWLDSYKKLEISDDYVYRSMYALEYLVYKCLRQKLDDEDYNYEESYEKIFKLSTSDDIFCYIDSNDSSKAYKALKRIAIKSLLKVLNNHLSLPNDTPQIGHLLKHSNIYSYELDTFQMQSSIKLQQKVYGKFYNNLMSAFADVCDFTVTESGYHLFVRYLNEESVLIWYLSSLEDMIVNSNKSQSIYLAFYECNLSIIDPNNTEATKSKHENIISQVLLRNITLIKRVYKSAFNYTYCEIYDSLEYCNDSLMIVIESCTVETQNINCSGLYDLIHNDWEDLNDLTEKILGKSVALLGNSFETMDSEFSEEICKSFTRIPNSNYYIFNKRQEGIFLKFGNFSEKLSHCLTHRLITFSLYQFPKEKFFSKEVKVLNKESTNSSNKLLTSLCDYTSALLSKQALFILSKVRPITESTLDQVDFHLKLIPEKVEGTVCMNLINKTQDCLELINSELQKNKVLYSKYINNTFYLISTSYEKNFFLNSDYNQDYCDINPKSDSEEFTIDFWLLFKAIHPNSIQFKYYLPKGLTYSLLTSEIIEREIIAKIKEIEVRVNQKILLRNLQETGRISSMLLQAESNVPSMKIESNVPSKEIASKSNQNRLWLQKNEVAQPQLSLKPQGSYKLQKQHQHDFPITDRLIKMDALSSLSARFSVPPFSIDNLEGTYMLVQSQEVWLFKFMEVLGQVSASFSDLRKSPKEEKKGLIDVRYIRLEIYGIDMPPNDTILKLEKNIEEFLQQTSLAKLADTLIKNQKKIMTSNDYQFIIGTSRSEIILYPIPEIITESGLLLSMTKQNLLRILSSFKIMDSTVMIYNYLNIFDTSAAKTNRNLLFRNHQSKPNYIGNIFGKALALISVEMIFFDGENISECKESGNTEEWNYTKQQVEQEINLLKKYHGQPTPSYTGQYIEVKVSKNGNLYTEAFHGQIDSCICQSIIEYILEKLLEKTRERSLESRFNYISECTASIANLLIPDHIEILHYTTWNNLFLVYSQITAIVEEQLDYKIKLIYGCTIEESSKASRVLKDVEEMWNNVSSEEFIGVKIVLRAMADPEVNLDNLNDDLKFYSSEHMGDVYVKRSVFVYIEVNSKDLRVFTYNIHKTTLVKLQNAVESHILWLRERYLLLNSALMQKLGFFFHNLVIDQEKTHTSLKNLAAILPRACCLLEIKEGKQKYPLESLINPYETQHSDANIDEDSFEFKLKGAYPLHRYTLGKFTDRDLVKRHGLYMSNFLDKKIEHASEYEMCAYAYMKWAFKKTPVIDRMISKISKRAVVRDEIHLVKSVLKSSQLFYRESAKYYIQHFIPSKTSKSQYVLCEVLKMYSDRLVKLTRFNNPIQTDNKSIRKNSFGDLENPVRFVKTYYSSGALSSEAKIENMQSYIKKSYDHALVVFEICYENSMIFTSGFCIENFFKCFPMYRWEDFKCNPQFIKELSKLKQSVDSVCLLYDIQIKCISNFLNHPKDYADIDVVSTLSLMHSDFLKPPRKCCNSIISCYIHLSFEESSKQMAEEIFIFFLMNSKELGYQSNISGTKSQYAFKKITDNHVENAEPSVRWCIYTSAGTKSSENHELAVRCFIVKHDESRKLKNESIKAVKQAAEKEFIKIMTEYKEHYRRDQLWNKIRESNYNFSFSDLQLLLGASKVTSMHDIDPRIKFLTSFKNVFTFACINYLTEVYHKESKIFEIGDKVHLIVIFSQRNLAQLILSREEQSLQMYSVTRSIGSSIKDEDNFITDMISKIIQWLWVRITTNSE